MRHLDLFSGIGGFAYAAQQVWGDEHEVVAFCEIDKFCQKVLKKHWPETEIINDIRNGKLREYKNIDLLTGGFPCQPFSVAGKRAGTNDDRYLWPAMLEVIRQTKPAWIIGENVAGIKTMAFEQSDVKVESRAIARLAESDIYEGVYSRIDILLLDSICEELENEGYEVQPIAIPACGLDAPHKRERVWIIANCTQLHDGGHNRESESGQVQQSRNGIEPNNDTYSNGADGFGRSGGSYTNKDRICSNKQAGDCSRGEPSRCDEDAANACDKGLEGSERRESLSERQTLTHGSVAECSGNSSWEENWLEVATEFCGIFNGISEWLHRNRGVKYYVKNSKSITGQDMPHLWQGFQSETFQWSSGRFNTIQSKENLFTVLWQLFAESYRQDDLPFESEEVQEAYLRNVWYGTKPGCPSQGWQYQEQYAKEHTDSLPLLSYEVAQATAKITEKYSMNRVDRLKSLGNAIVPQVAMVIMKAIYETTTRTS